MNGCELSPFLYLYIYAVYCIALFLAQQGRSWLTRRWSSYWLARRTLRATSTMRSLSGLSSAPKFPLCPSCHYIWVGIRPLPFYLPLLAPIYVCLKLPNVCILFQIHLYIFVKSWLYVHSYTNLYFIFLQLTSMLLFLARKNSFQDQPFSNTFRKSYSPPLFTMGSKVDFSWHKYIFLCGPSLFN